MRRPEGHPACGPSRPTPGALIRANNGCACCLGCISCKCRRRQPCRPRTAGTRPPRRSRGLRWEVAVPSRPRPGGPRPPCRATPAPRTGSTATGCGPGATRPASTAGTRPPSRPHRPWPACARPPDLLQARVAELHREGLVGPLAALRPVAARGRVVGQGHPRPRARGVGLAGAVEELLALRRLCVHPAAQVEQRGAIRLLP